MSESVKFVGVGEDHLAVAVNCVSVIMSESVKFVGVCEDHSAVAVNCVSVIMSESVKFVGVCEDHSAVAVNCVSVIMSESVRFVGVCEASWNVLECAFVSDCSTKLHIHRVGQNHIYMVYIRYFWQGNHQIYGHIRCIYTVLANPTHSQCNKEDLSALLVRCFTKRCRQVLAGQGT